MSSDIQDKSRSGRRWVNFAGLPYEGRRMVGEWAQELTGGPVRFFTDNVDEYDGAMTLTCGLGRQFKPLGKPDSWLVSSTLAGIARDSPHWMIHVTHHPIGPVADRIGSSAPSGSALFGCATNHGPTQIRGHENLNLMFPSSDKSKENGTVILTDHKLETVGERYELAENGTEAGPYDYRLIDSGEWDATGPSGGRIHARRYLLAQPTTANASSRRRFTSTPVSSRAFSRAPTYVARGTVPPPAPSPPNASSPPSSVGPSGRRRTYVSSDEEDSDGRSTECT